MTRVATDAHLVTLVRQGWPQAFETVYTRYHRSILSFCRHMLGDADEAEDVVQHTFLAAYNDLIASEKPILLRPWLFTIARNRCYTVLRSRREHPAAELDEQATEGLATQVQLRQDLRDLVVDVRQLPDDQRAALVLAELDALSHDQIAEVLGVPSKKVKALVFQARESLLASRTARDTACSDIREQLATGRGAALRRANLRRHLRECQGCNDFRKQVDRQRRGLAAILPVVPSLALKDGILTATVGAGAATGVATGGLPASAVFKSVFLKGVLGLIIAGASAGTLVATHPFSPPAHPTQRNRGVLQRHGAGVRATPPSPGSAHGGAAAGTPAPSLSAASAASSNGLLGLGSTAAVVHDPLIVSLPAAAGSPVHAPAISDTWTQPHHTAAARARHRDRTHLAPAHPGASSHGASGAATGHSHHAAAGGHGSSPVATPHSSSAPYLGSTAYGSATQGSSGTVRGSGTSGGDASGGGASSPSGAGATSHTATGGSDPASGSSSPASGGGVGSSSGSGSVSGGTRGSSASGSSSSGSSYSAGSRGTSAQSSGSGGGSPSGASASSGGGSSSGGSSAGSPSSSASSGSSSSASTSGGGYGGSASAGSSSAPAGGGTRGGSSSGGSSTPVSSAPRVSTPGPAPSSPTAPTSSSSGSAAGGSRGGSASTGSTPVTSAPSSSASGASGGSGGGAR